MKKNHKNDKRRITAKERLQGFFEKECNVARESGLGAVSRVPSVDAYQLKMLQDHARAAVARYKRKHTFTVMANGWELVDCAWYCTHKSGCAIGAIYKKSLDGACAVHAIAMGATIGR